MTLLEIRSLRKVFQPGLLERRLVGTPSQIEAVRQMTLSIQRKEIFGLVGESGSGKSTVANCVLGLEAPTAGEILFAGEPLTASARGKLAGRIQAVFQDPDGSLNPTMRVVEIIREPLDILAGTSRDERGRRVEEVLQLVGLSRDLLGELPRRLSGGEKQRVAIARALVVDPDLLLADEPVSALDTSVQAQILNLLGSLRARLGLTILFISHDLNVVGQLCDRVAVMVRGALVEVAATDQLFQSPLHPYTKSLLASIVPLNPSLARRWVEEAPAPWEGDPGPLEEAAPGHWVARV